MATDPSHDESWSVQLIEALSRVWMRIRLLHPQVPAVVLLAAPGHHKQQNVLGHFAALRWRGRHRADEHLHEVVVVAEHLDRPVADILETLLHEAAHAANFEAGIRDCSRSQYHNERFRSAALELGLCVERVAHYGFAKTSLAAGTAERYEHEVLYLERVLIHRRKPLALPKVPGAGPTTGGDGDDDGEKPRSRLRKAVCDCGFIIRVARKTIEDTTIRCESCGAAFRLA